ncbi:Ammonium transporter [Pyrenophora tritici-repentis]|uniref:Ammonium transporter n=2 Tax=Pyrenophora tritici-repentis TaxID=45151 RepID=A0A922N710_9PLEO|nr:ammonium transporter 1 [Pyrenophora tritici-repentis Pt-1C-BFP]EDU47867.1 ammonium transporter 1 [Pyrenophora tritici-repentis Pt-1C-BFP]KAI1510350.1 Ammonium transporter [Pyrenophora tritici-repentis]KAI1668509.1 Ammonium transporter [Pyrenophora tritici-repentis]KAI1680696.1 Ammonium transporter [Pyrenophora tritici-repentis]
MASLPAPTPITEWPDYAVDPNGGNVMTTDLNALYDKGDLCWMQITPAIGFLYAGMHRRKAALTMIFQSLFCACAVGIQFWVYGYSLYQSHTTNPFIGDLSKAGLHNTLGYPSLANADIPDILYACFGFTFVTCTAMILAGAMLERGRLFPSMLFLLCWTTFVYYVLAYAEWNPSGWLYKLGVYDFAGSGPVHIASGFSALAWAVMLGPRVDLHKEAKFPHFKPHNPFLVGLGTILIWFGWFAFNGASTANISIRSVYIACNTNLAACGGGMAWVLLEYASTRKFSIIGFCSGIIAGLVGITPACGYVRIQTAALIGALTSCGSFFTVKYKYLLRIDEGLDIFAIHGVGGYIGDILTGFFAAPYIPAMDGVSNTYEGGWWAKNWKQMVYQLAAATFCAAWSFVISIILLFIINRIPGCHIRAAEDDELKGLDYKYFSDADGDMMVLTGFGAAIPGFTTSQVVSGARSHQDVPVEPEKRD